LHATTTNTQQNMIDKRRYKNSYIYRDTTNRNLGLSNVFSYILGPNECWCL